MSYYSNKPFDFGAHPDQDPDPWEYFNGQFVIILRNQLPWRMCALSECF